MDHQKWGWTKKNDDWSGKQRTTSHGTQPMKARWALLWITLRFIHRNGCKCIVTMYFCVYIYIYTLYGYIYIYILYVSRYIYVYIYMYIDIVHSRVHDWLHFVTALSWLFRRTRLFMEVVIVSEAALITLIFNYSRMDCLSIANYRTIPFLYSCECHI